MRDRPGGPAVDPLRRPLLLGLGGWVAAVHAAVAEPRVPILVFHRFAAVAVEQSHTYWHPNLLRERQRMPPASFERFAADQLVRARHTLARRLGQPADLLAWPFGLSADGLALQARQAGYVAAFSLGNRSATPHDALYAVPRHLIVNGVDAAQLGRRLEAAFDGRELR
jgi:hypothetical protein